MITLKNDFHNTEYRTRKTWEQIEKILDTAPWNRSEKDQRFASKVRRTLCGISNCKCGDDLGLRGHQND